MTPFVLALHVRPITSSVDPMGRATTLISTLAAGALALTAATGGAAHHGDLGQVVSDRWRPCLLYTSDAADE